MTQPAPAAAWFPDPHDPSRLRWWDGAGWTEHVHPPAAPVAPVMAPVAPVMAPVAPVAAPVEVAAPVAAPVEVAAPAQQFGDPEDEEIFDTYYGNEEPRSGFGLHFRTRFTVGDDSTRERLHGKATISKVHADTAPSAGDEAAERARLREIGMDDEQIETAIRAGAKLRGLMDKAAGSRLGSMAAHAALKQLAWSTARGGRGDAMDVVFDGRRYRATGSHHRA